MLPTPLAVERYEAAAGEAAAMAVREARKPFDLETGPLIRLLLIEAPALSESRAGETPVLPARELLLVLVLHHILADERSLGVLWKELADGYNGRSPAGEPPQYDEYVHWLAGRREAWTAELAYW